MDAKRFAKFAWFVLAWNILVILWGAWVRLSFSGDGCGAHWPLCNGSLVPSFSAETKTWVEFTHRIMSALDGFLILGMTIWAFLRFGPRSLERRIAVVSLLFTFTESMIGRQLVKRGLVAQNDSIERAIWLGVHLANTFILIGSIALLAAYASGFKRPQWKGQGPILCAMGFGLVALLVLGVSGAITSLGDKLFPVTSTPKAISDALDSTKHFLIQLRVLHPLIAVSVGIYLVLIAGLINHLRPSAIGAKLSKIAIAGFGLQIVVGLLNVVLKAPDAMAIIHLLLADAVWLSVIVWAAAAVGEAPAVVEAPAVLGRATWKDYLALTKPRIISLLLFTTMTALCAAAGGWPGTGLFFAVLIGGYMAAGAGNAINMVIDRDIDSTMKRTASRPTVTQRISSTNALYFGFTLALASFGILWFAANLLSAVLALAGLAFYVVIYTLLLKRRTWQNIVIGGAAGAFPPLVGWTAYTNQLSPIAWILFAIIFVWTPVHFWALALMIKDEYAEVGVPMLPVVRGERATVIQIVWYGVLTAAVSILPFFVSNGNGPAVAQLYLWSAVVLNLCLLLLCIRLYQVTDRPHALRLFKFSMIYLALLFLVFAIDCSIDHRRRSMAAFWPSGASFSSTPVPNRQGSLNVELTHGVCVVLSKGCMECVNGPAI